MSQLLTREATSRLNQLQFDFLQELTKKIRLTDTANKYQDWTDLQLIEQLVICSVSQPVDSEKNNLDPLDELLITAFYQAIGAVVEKTTGHSTKTFVHLNSEEFDSAVIFCGGVMVLYSLSLDRKSFCFTTLKELADIADNYIHHALAKAICYFNF
ncbi:DUF269 domain-containing protein [Myxosarcina sp. GI1]|uniref:DUF269 domain-containing protein n=1 Tax=Myxosarcina sp. GI1 TaxID=1541065 RepID=UPI00068F414A|nr:DUF269 domain-containing protein [Myxosarcina sp. GI1]